MDSAHSIYTILPPPANSPPTVLRYSEGLLSIKLLASPMLSYPKYLQTSKRSKALFRYGTLRPDAENTIYLNNNEYLGRLDLIHLRSIKSQNPESLVQIDENSKLCLDPSFVQTVVNSNLKDFKTYGRPRFCPLNSGFELGNFRFSRFYKSSILGINNPSFYCTGPVAKVSDRCTRLITDDDFCRRMTNNTKRMELGLNSDWDCRPYMTDQTIPIGEGTPSASDDQDGNGTPN
uniref:Receptor L-domain domain-containing protein n=1 Tax=Caenorhabditis japonica TaxID=281687 RepID=A0A8R1DIG2_CAEJA